MHTLMKLVLYGKMKSGKNAMRVDPRTGRHYASPQFVAWRANMVRQIAVHTRATNVYVYKTPLKASINYWPGDLIKRDAPGIIDALWHVLEYSRIVTDDALISDVTFSTMPLDRKNPRCELVLQSIPCRGMKQ